MKIKFFGSNKVLLNAFVFKIWWEHSLIDKYSLKKLFKKTPEKKLHTHKCSIKIIAHFKLGFCLVEKKIVNKYEKHIIKKY